MMKFKLLGPLFVLVGIVTFLLSTVATSDAYDRKTSQENAVRIDVLPLKLASGQETQFEVRMNTHSVALNQDLSASSVLLDDQGHKYQPIRWEGSAPGGHHRRGVLKFPALSGTPGSVTLIIRNVANVSERTFEWAIKQ